MSERLQLLGRLGAHRARCATWCCAAQLLVENENYVGSKTSGKFIERAIDPKVVNSPLDTEFTRTSLTGAAVPTAS